jgi:hypothetical protein
MDRSETSRPRNVQYLVHISNTDTNQVQLPVHSKSPFGVEWSTADIIFHS